MSQAVPQVPPKLYGEGLTPYLEPTHLKSQSWEESELMGKFTPSKLRGRIPIPVAPGAFSQEEEEGVWMEVPGQPGMAVLECRVSPWHQARGDTSTLQSKDASPA